MKRKNRIQSVRSERKGKILYYCQENPNQTIGLTSHLLLEEIEYLQGFGLTVETLFPTSNVNENGTKNYKTLITLYK